MLTGRLKTVEDNRNGMMKVEKENRRNEAGEKQQCTVVIFSHTQNILMPHFANIFSFAIKGLKLKPLC